MSSGKRITVLLAEDHMIVREGLRKLLETERDIEVIGEASTGREAVAEARRLRPSVIVMDIAMPQLNGIEATRQIRRILPDSKVLILSAHSDETYIEKLTSLGAMGYLVKQTSAHLLAEAIHELYQGRMFFSPTIISKKRLKDAVRLDRKGKPKTTAGDLTSREMEVLQLIAEGEANKQIASELSISIKTVEKHRDHLMQKLNIHDTASLTRYAIIEGIIECNVPLKVV